MTPASPSRVQDETPGANSSDSTAVLTPCQIPQRHPHGTPASLLVVGLKAGTPPPQVSAGETEAGGKASQAVPKGPVPSNPPRPG